MGFELSGPPKRRRLCNQHTPVLKACHRAAFASCGMAAVACSVYYRGQVREGSRRGADPLVTAASPSRPGRARRAGVVFQESRVEGVAHGDGASELCCADGVRVPAAMVLDATGHSRKLVQFDAPFDPGYQARPTARSRRRAHLRRCSRTHRAQIRGRVSAVDVIYAILHLHADTGADSDPRARQGAYGILVEVERHPFALDTMLFMDWRDDYAASDPQMLAANRCAP